MSEACSILMSANETIGVSSLQSAGGAVLVSGTLFKRSRASIFSQTRANNGATLCLTRASVAR